jgi:hypothetical protein
MFIRPRQMTRHDRMLSSGDTFRLYTLREPGTTLHSDRCLTRGSPRAFRAWPLAWPSPSGPQGRQRLHAQGWVPKMLSAERLERIFGCPCGWRGRSVQCAAFRPCACDPFTRRLVYLRETTGQASFVRRGHARYVTAGCGLRRGAGERCGGQRPAPVRFRARGGGPGCPATCGEAPRHPGHDRAALARSFNAPPCVPRTLRAWAWAGRRGAPKVRP